MVVCLEQGADLHMAQWMPLPLTVTCFSKIQTGFVFLVPANLGSPRKGPLNGCVCVIHCVLKLLHYWVGERKGVTLESVKKPVPLMASRFSSMAYGGGRIVMSNLCSSGNGC